MKPRHLSTERAKLRGFCRAYLDRVPDSGETKRTSHQIELEALHLSKKHYSTMQQHLPSKKMVAEIYNQ